MLPNSEKINFSGKNLKMQIGKNTPDLVKNEFFSKEEIKYFNPFVVEDENNGPD